FLQYQGYEKVFGFLFTSDRLRSLNDTSLMDDCVNLEDALKNDEHKDIDGKELFGELLFIQDLIVDSMGPLDILKFLKELPFYPNATVVYKILLIIHVTVASAETSFSKLKLLKSYLRSTMTQERLNGLTIIAIENNVLDNIIYEDIIEDFISRNSFRIMFFSRT
uniref:HAT C-terminal dimerisation domain-containing protein n=1 Tax=Oryza brachyantha TaxID=4533 RepID=J3MFV4_ORYBR